MRRVVVCLLEKRIEGCGVFFYGDWKRIERFCVGAVS